MDREQEEEQQALGLIEAIWLAIFDYAGEGEIITSGRGEVGRQLTVDGAVLAYALTDVLAAQAAQDAAIKPDFDAEAHADTIRRVFLDQFHHYRERMAAGAAKPN